MDKALLLYRPRLKEAFDVFDKDGNDRISFDELKQLLKDGQGFEEDTFQELFDKIDRNDDGKINFYGFEKMM